MTTIALPQINPYILIQKPKILQELLKFLPPDAILSELVQLLPYETDALTAYTQKPMLVVLPSTIGQVQEIVKLCNRLNIRLVPRGAGTSLAGGALPLEDSIVLSIARLNTILDIDTQSRFVHVQAGVTNLAISKAVEHLGFFYAPDPSSQLACTIAGNIANNSGGPHCLKYGVTTNNLLAVTLVLMDGTVLEIGSEALDSAGYDLLGLLTGSEGQFGIIVAAKVKIVHAAQMARAALLGFRSVEDAGKCVANIIAAGILPVAMEFLDKPAIIACEAFAHAGYPVDAEAMLIIEVEGSETEIAASFEKIRPIAEQNGVFTMTVSTTPQESATIWKGRKSAYGAMGNLGDFICMDGTIPTSQLSFALKTISEICARYGLSVASMFHAGDGNLHPLIVYDANAKGALETVEACGAEILKLCVDLGGCLTGEHGVGIEKRDLMPLQFNRLDMLQQVAVKRVFDPKWLLNYGKVFPLEYQA